MTSRRPTKYEARLGLHRPERQSEIDLPTKEEMRKIDQWLSGQPSRTELPKRHNIEERKRKNRARAKADQRRMRWQRRHKKEWAKKMREYRLQWKQRNCPQTGMVA